MASRASASVENDSVKPMQSVIKTEWGGTMHPEHRCFCTGNVDLDDLLGIFVSGRYDNAVATREDLLRPAARNEGIFDRERMARHQSTAAGRHCGTGFPRQRQEGPKQVILDSKGALIDRLMPAAAFNVTARVTATMVQRQSQATEDCRWQPHQCR